MSDETNSEVKVEATTEVAPEAETIPETKSEENFLDVFEETPVKPEDPVADPGFESAEYDGHTVEFNEAGDCFISKDGQCLGLAAGAIKKVSDVTDIIKQREKGE